MHIAKVDAGEGEKGGSLRSVEPLGVGARGRDERAGGEVEAKTRGVGSGVGGDAHEMLEQE